MFKESSDRIVKEISVVALIILAMLSGAFFMFLKSSYAQELLVIFKSAEQVKVVQANQEVSSTTSTNTPVVQSGSTISEQSVTNAPPLSISTPAEDVQHTNSNEEAPVNTNVSMQTSNENTNSSPVEVQNTASSIQAYAQKKLDTSYLVVKRPYEENKVFDMLTPFASKVKVDRYIIQKDGKAQGYLYELVKIDGSMTSTYAFMKDLAENILKNDKVVVTDAPFGKRSFYYNHIDKTEVIRIVIESRMGGVYALEIPSVLSSDFKEFLRQL